MNLTMSDKERGLYAKYAVIRTDGSSAVGERHHGCDYFVLDITHDPHAREALATYAESCGLDYPQLAGDLYSLLKQHGWKDV